MCFTGSFVEGQNWTKAVRGTWSDGDVWKATVTVPSSGSFKWKPKKGTYVSSEIVNEGEVSEWYPYDDMTYPGGTFVNW